MIFRKDFPLLLIGPFVDNDLHGAVTLVNGSGPGYDQGRTQPIKPNIAVMAFVNLITDSSTAISVRWQRVELARTAVRAVAINQLATFNHPLGLGHGASPVS